VGLFAWLFGPKSQPLTITRPSRPDSALRQAPTPLVIATRTVTVWAYEGRGKFPTQIHGESYRQDEIALGLCGRKPWEEPCTFEAMLRGEFNAYDDNAVAVYRVEGGQIGFLTRATARVWRPVLDALFAEHGVYVACKAIVYAKPDRPMGVWLDVELKHVKKELEIRRAGRR
jgi:hypothetical protein